MGKGSEERNGFSLSKKYDKYVTEIDHPVAKKTENSHKGRNPKSHSKDPEKKQTSPTDVRRSRGLAYFLNDQVDEIEGKSSDILEENVKKGMSSLIMKQGKKQHQRSTCPPGFSGLPPLLSYNVERGMSSLIITDCEQDQEKRQRPTCPPGFSDIPRALINNIDCDGDKARNNVKVVFEARGIIPGGAGGTSRFSDLPTTLEAEEQSKVPTIVAGLQDIIDNWSGEYAMSGQYNWF